MIFISHRQADEQQALNVAALLKSKNIQFWVDVLDPATKHSATDITKHIMSSLDRCSHVMVIFTVNTAGSMWVPFELGAAYKSGKGIGTYLADSVSTPAYLDTFPKLKTTTDIDQYLEEYKNDQLMAKSATGERSFQMDEARNADSFIKRVKTRLRQ
jgi:hypothetical protein